MGGVLDAVTGRTSANREVDQYNRNREQQLGYADASSDLGLLNNFGEGTAIGDYLRSEDPLVNRSQSSTSTTMRKFVQDEYKGDEANLKGFWNDLMSGDKYSAEGIEKLNTLKANDTYGNIEAVLGDKMAGMGLSPMAGGAGLGAVEAMRGQDIVRGRLGAEREALGIQHMGAQGLQQLLGMAGIGTRTNSSTSSSSWQEGALAPGQQVLLDQYLDANKMRMGIGAHAEQVGRGEAAGQFFGNLGGQAGATWLGNRQ